MESDFCLCWLLTCLWPVRISRSYSTSLCRRLFCGAKHRIPPCSFCLHHYHHHWLHAVSCIKDINTHTQTLVSTTSFNIQDIYTQRQLLRQPFSTLFKTYTHTHTETTVSTTIFNIQDIYTHRDNCFDNHFQHSRHIHTHIDNCFDNHFQHSRHIHTHRQLFRQPFSTFKTYTHRQLFQQFLQNSNLNTFFPGKMALGTISSWSKSKTTAGSHFEKFQMVIHISATSYPIHFTYARLLYMLCPRTLYITVENDRRLEAMVAGRPKV